VNEPIVKPAIDFNPRGILESKPLPTPNNPPWNIPVALGVFVLSVIFVLLVPMLFLAPYLIKQGIDFSDKEKVRDFIFTDPTAIILQLAPVILAHGLTRRLVRSDQI
jgi:hypothetical protein